MCYALVKILTYTVSFSARTCKRQGLLCPISLMRAQTGNEETLGEQASGVPPTSGLKLQLLAITAPSPSAACNGEKGRGANTFALAQVALVAPIDSYYLQYCKGATNTEFVKTGIYAPEGKTGLGFCDPLVPFSPTGQYITLLYVCFLMYFVSNVFCYNLFLTALYILSTLNQQ